MLEMSICRDSVWRRHYGYGVTCSWRYGRVMESSLLATVEESSVDMLAAEGRRCSFSHLHTLLEVCIYNSTTQIQQHSRLQLLSMRFLKHFRQLVYRLQHRRDLNYPPRRHIRRLNHLLPLPNRRPNNTQLLCNKQPQMRIHNRYWLPVRNLHTNHQREM